MICLRHGTVRAVQGMLVLNRARYGVTSLPVSVGGAIRQRLPVQMSASEAKGSRAPRTHRGRGSRSRAAEGLEFLRASRGMYHLHLTGAGEHSNRLGPTGRDDGVRLLHPKLFSCLLGRPAAAATPRAMLVSLLLPQASPPDQQASGPAPPAHASPSQKKLGGGRVHK